jgi:inner membrane protein
MEKQTNFFQSNTAKIIMVGFLTLILLIPLQFVKSLIEERSVRQKEVVSETSEKWGEAIYFYGPILKIPYKVHTESMQYEAKTNQHVKPFYRNSFGLLLPGRTKKHHRCHDGETLATQFI